MSRVSAYIVITHLYHPISSGPEKGKVKVNEQIDFVDRLKNRHLDSATAIIDFPNAKMVKNRATEATFENYMGYLEEKYPDQMKKFYTFLGLTIHTEEAIDHDSTAGEDINEALGAIESNGDAVATVKISE